MRAILTAVIIVLWTATASAQVRLPVGEPAKKKEGSDSAYREALDKIPNQRAPADPWSNVRAAPPAKSQKKSQQK